MQWIFSKLQYNTTVLKAILVSLGGLMQKLSRCFFLPYADPNIILVAAWFENQPTFGRLWFAHMNFWKLLELTFAWHVSVWAEVSKEKTLVYFNGYKSQFSSLLIYPFMGSSHVKKRFSDPRTQQKRTASTKDFMKKQHEIKYPQHQQRWKSKENT